MRAYVLQATKLKKDGFPRVVKNWKMSVVFFRGHGKIIGVFPGKNGAKFPVNFFK